MAHPLTLENLTGRVRYRAANGEIVGGVVTSRILYPRHGVDTTFPDPYRVVHNDKGYTVSVTAQTIARGDIWRD